MDTTSLDEILERKHVLRGSILASRRAISPDNKSEYDRIIRERVLRIAAVTTAQTVAAYCSLPEEVATAGIVETLLGEGKTLALPRVAGNSLAFFSVRGQEDCEPGVFGLMEPKTTCPKVLVSDIGCFLVPGLAFDRQGYRLGWGKGYYDRAMAGTTVPKVGLAYDCQIVPDVPHTSGDLPMTLIVTESGILSPTAAQ
jgi:5-formyltetrahydrofolate cyclo-ligase